LSAKFSVHEIVSTNDPNFEPLVSVDTVGTIVKIHAPRLPKKETAYDVLVETTEGTTEEFFYFESELSEVK